MKACLLLVTELSAITMAKKKEQKALDAYSLIYSTVICTLYARYYTLKVDSQSLYKTSCFSEKGIR